MNTTDTANSAADLQQGGERSSKEVVPKVYLVSFILVTLCFPLWGFANDITNPLVKAFSKVLQMSTTQST
ncbi:hypothetical protein [Psychrosphaera algicola]|uniref:Uncharacterized protein n=2 Tax=Psychrosphaera TaxID=907197 RepID=A0ABT5FCN0_9GAMM|nr:hypothetical protein [Psychrosphaera sp. G1-22]MDC2889300.1 hypothetical protein [Psychrosphaera sp. G1-22]